MLPKSLLKVRNGFCTADSVNHIHNLLRSTRKALFSQEHDRIFSLFGLLHPEFVALIKADYSLNVTDVFKNVCLAWVDHYEDLRFLGFLGSPQSVSDTFQPSWVPNWMENPMTEPFSIFLASGMSVCGPIDCGNDSSLVVFGVLCGKV
jgi:hypothetical protein